MIKCTKDERLISLTGTPDDWIILAEILRVAIKIANDYQEIVNDYQKTDIQRAENFIDVVYRNIEENS